MPTLTATAVACANIAFIKYWGNRDARLRLPVNGSISMNLDGLISRTRVAFRPELERDVLNLNKTPIYGKGLDRISSVLDLIRELAGFSLKAEVVSSNNFPTGAGIASSAAAFAALAVSASQAAGLHLSEPELSRLARRGSGSAARSVPGGFVEWSVGNGDADSVAASIAPPDHWQLVDFVAIVQGGPKSIGSTEGHALAGESLFQTARVQDAPRRLAVCREAILERNFNQLAEIVELDSNLMHAVMMTSTPPLFYWEPASIRLMRMVPNWRREGLAVCYTLDAGPNVHVICQREAADETERLLERVPGIRAILKASPGGPARCVA